MKRRTILIIALLLVTGLSSAFIIFYISNSGSAFCEHPIGPNQSAKVRLGEGDHSESTSNLLCEHPTSIHHPSNQHPIQLENTNRVDQPKLAGQK